ncbi:MAG: formate dehydrogenase accessory sulfurtransferase FdhD [bacterium]
MDRAIKLYRIFSFKENSRRETKDTIVKEEPLGILINSEPYAVLMRTPGFEEDLAMGFLYSEGIIGRKEDVEVIHYCEKEKEKNTVVVVLKNKRILKNKKRAFEVRSSCGICGEDVICGLEKVLKKVPSSAVFSNKKLYGLDKKIFDSQKIFRLTGGTHAAALFNKNGRMLFLREDIGRHNALDKIAGFIIKKNINCGDKIVFLSGRTSYEMVLKAIRLGVPVVASISGSTSLAVNLSEKFDLTLIGFLRGDKMNIYTHPWRIK